MLKRIFALFAGGAARKVVIENAVAEVLENRHMLAARVLGELPSGFRTELYAKEHHTEYRFSVSGVMRVNAWVGSGRATIARDGTPLLSGRDLTKDLKAGDYTLTVQSPPGQVFKMSARRVAALPPTRLQASVWGGKAIRLNWDDNGDTEVQYRVDRWTKLGWRRGIRVGQDATAAVIDNLPLGSKTTYRVSAVTRTGASVASTNIVTAQTLNEDTTGWYKVKLSGNTRGEAGWTMQADTLKIATDYQGDNGWSKWVYASSWQTAVWTAIHSAPDPVKIKVTYNAAGRIKGDIVEHNFPSGGDFKVATAGELRAAQGSEGKNGFKLSPLANETKLIALEDSYGGIDRDYDDFYWTITTQYTPGVSITAQGTATEGQSRAIDDNSKLGVWVRRTGKTNQSLNVKFKFGGNAEFDSDVHGIPSQVTIPAGKNELFVPIGITEDTIPEWTELFQVKVEESNAYRIVKDQPEYVSFLIADDDYFYLGSYEAPAGIIHATVNELSGGSVVSTFQEQLPIEVVGNELNAIAGVADANWLPWLNGESTSDGDDRHELFDKVVDALPTEQGNSSAGLRASALGDEVPGDPMVHARNLAILEEHRPGFTFEVGPSGTHYLGTDAAGRTVQYNLNLTEIAYKGTHQGFYLKLNDDGSIDKWGGEFVEEPQLIEQVRPPDQELKRLINLAKDKCFEDYNEQTEEHQLIRENFEAFCDALHATLAAGMSLAPGATAIDLDEFITGEDPFNPSVQVSGGSRVASAASIVPIVGALKKAKQLSEAGQRLRDNWKAGREFQALVTNFLGEIGEIAAHEGENRVLLRKLILNSGKRYNTIPDIVSFANNTIIEIKRVDRLGSLSNQLREQMDGAQILGMKYKLILGPNATIGDIANTVTKKIDDLNNFEKGYGVIAKFNPETRTLEQIYP